jgi:hypothetical protein
VLDATSGEFCGESNELMSITADKQTIYPLREESVALKGRKDAVKSMLSASLVNEGSAAEGMVLPEDETEWDKECAVLCGWFCSAAGPPSR